MAKKLSQELISLELQLKTREGSQIRSIFSKETFITQVPCLPTLSSWSPSGSNQNDPTLVELLATKSKDFVPSLLKELDITLTDLVNCGGHSVARTHKPANWPTGDSQSVGRLLVNQVSSFSSSFSLLSHSFSLDSEHSRMWSCSLPLVPSD